MGPDDPTWQRLSDAELLALLIHSGVGDDSTERLLRRFGSLRALLQADLESITSERGIGVARATVLRCLPEIARRYFSEAVTVGEAIRSPSETETFLQAKMRHLGHELFCCLYLDNRHRVLRFDEMFRGTIDGTSVYPREVVKEALRINAAAVILAHNR